MSRFVSGWMIAAFAMLLSVSSAMAQTSPIKVGLYQNEPKIFVDTEGNAAGFFPELLEHIAEQEGWDIEYFRCSWADCLQGIESGTLDLMPDVAWSEDREERFAFSSEVVFSNWSVLYVAQGDSISSIMDMHDRRVAVVEDGIQRPAFEKLAESFDVNVEFTETETLQQVFELLDSGSVDAGLVNRLYGAHNEHRYGVSPSDVLVNPSLLHFIAPKQDNGRLLDVIDRHLVELKKDQSSAYYEISNRWLAPEVEAKTPDWFPYVLATLFIGLVIVIVFNAMLRREVANQTRELEISVESLRLNAAKLVQAKRDAEIAAKARADFLTSMSHELNTPLNVIIGFSELLTQNTGDPLSPTQKTSAEKILEAGTELHEVVRKVLSFSELTDRKTDVELQDVNISQIAGGCIQVAQAEGDKNGIKVRFDPPSQDVPLVRIDPDYGKEIFLTFLSNAIAYNKPDGEVRLEISSPEANRVRFSVYDTGQGIPEDRHSEVFMPFNRLGLENTSISGTGVGLSIAKVLSDMMGGTIGFESVEGVGSTFWVEFPAANAD